MEFKFENTVFSFDSDYKISMCISEKKENYIKLKIKMDFEKKLSPKPVTLKWTMPSCDIIGHWNPVAYDFWGPLPNWKPNSAESRSVFSAPVFCHYGVDGKNAETVSLTDVLTPIRISAGFLEEPASLGYAVTFFTQLVSEMEQYETELVIDTRKIPFYEAIGEVSKMWEELGYKSAPVPEKAMRPMYSTWYNYHQNLDCDEIIEEMRLAKSYGMETVIVDDGWQTLDSNFGYAFCGDWEPERIPDMKGFVDAIHDTGMDYMLWYSVPFVGKNSKAIKKFEGKFLNKLNESLGCHTLDPRFPSVREYLVSMYEKAVLEWGLDGLKLDFIDAFELTENSNMPNEEMDYESLEEAVCGLLKEIMNKLVKIKPDILIEFREHYMGPIMRTYGNMLRVGDCPMSLLHNRVGGFNLRMLAGETAVHSDMLMWSYDDTPEAAALEVINILFLVPQISMKLKDLPESHRKMLKFYLDFWNKHRDCLLKGKLTLKNPEANYSIVYSENKSELIAVSYTKNILDAEKIYDNIYFVNGSADEELIINNKTESYKALFTVYNCMGEITERNEKEVIEGLSLIKTPKSGMVHIEKI